MHQSSHGKGWGEGRERVKTGKEWGAERGGMRWGAGRGGVKKRIRVGERVWGKVKGGV